MNIRAKLVESLASTWKSRIILYLKQEGYVTYAERLNDIKFVIADIYHGSRIPVAAMFPNYGEIVINPAMLDKQYFQGQSKKMMDQLSVLIRHELLHFLLVHSKRLSEHMAKKDPEWEKKYRKYSIHELANMAMDWDLSKEGYDEDDKKVVRQMTKYNKVIGGLILSDDHPEWINLTFEEILDKLIDEKEKEMAQAKKNLENSQQNQQQRNQNSSSDSSNELDSQDTDSNSDENQNKNNNSKDQESDNDNLDQSNGQDDSADSEDEQNNSETNSKNSEDKESNENDANEESSEDADDEGNDELEDKRNYANAWNEIMDRFDNDEISEDELEQLIADIESGKIISL